MPPKREKKKQPIFRPKGPGSMPAAIPANFFCETGCIELFVPGLLPQQTCVSLLLLLSRRTPLTDQVIPDNAGCHSEAGRWSHKDKKRL